LGVGKYEYKILATDGHRFPQINCKADELPWIIFVDLCLSVGRIFSEETNTNWADMAKILIQLDPAKLSNPDLDIRYLLPDLIVEKSGGRITDSGYDFVGKRSSPSLMLFLRSDDAEAALSVVIEVLQNERILDNDLSDVPVAIEDNEEFRVAYPPNFRGNFQRPAKAKSE